MAAGTVTTRTGTAGTSTAGRRRYDVLPPEDLARGLRALPQWRCEGGRLLRTTSPPDLWALLESVCAAEEELDHHAVATLDTGAVTFAVWTHVRDGLTELDLELARRIEDLLG